MTRKFLLFYLNSNSLIFIDIGMEENIFIQQMNKKSAQKYKELLETTVIKVKVQQVLFLGINIMTLYLYIDIGMELNIFILQIFRK